MVAAIQIKIVKGSGCASVGKAVASDTRGPRFESSHRQSLLIFYKIECFRKKKFEKGLSQVFFLSVSFISIHSFAHRGIVRSFVRSLQQKQQTWEKMIESVVSSVEQKEK